MQEKLQNDFVEELKNDVFKNFAEQKKLQNAELSLINKS